MNSLGTASNLSIRVVLAGLPAMLAAIVQDAVRGEGICIVEVVSDRTELSDVVRRHSAQVIIVPSESSGVAHQYHDLVRQNPEVKILTIAAVSHSADLYELRLLGTNVGRRDVVVAIRAVVGGDTPRMTDQQCTQSSTPLRSE